MKYLIEKLKLASVGIMALSFLMAVTLGSCGNTSSTDNSEATEAVEEPADEHPAGEHPAGDTEEHPTDSTSTGGEHPE